MSEDLIARLKAAHEAATPGPWEAETSAGGEWYFEDDQTVARDSDGDAVFVTNGTDDANVKLAVLLRNNADSIIAALEERERMLKVVPVVVEFLRHFTDPDLDTADDPSSWLEHWEYGDAMRLIAYWTAEGRAALDALEKKG